MTRIRAASPALTGDRLMEPDIAAMAEPLGAAVLAEGIAAETIAGFGA